MKTTESSSLRALLEARRPHEKKIPLNGFPGISGDVVVRVLRKGAMNQARAAALARVDKLAEKVPALKEDPTFAREQQTIALLFAAIRDANDPAGLPAFPSPEWMEENFTTAEFDYLLNAYNAFVGEVYPGGVDHLQPDKLVALLDMLAENAHTDLPNETLLLFSREVLAEIVVRSALLRRDALNEAEDAQHRLDALVAAGFVPPDESTAAEDETLSAFAARLVASEPDNHVLANAAPKIRTERDAALVMSMLGWKEGSPAWNRVLGREAGGWTV